MQETLNENELFAHAPNTPKDGTKQQKKRKYLKLGINKSEAYLLGGKR